MNPAPASMSAMLASRSKDLLAAVEFYAPTYAPSLVNGFEPDDAIAKFATETVPTYVFSGSITVGYVRELFEAPAISRTITKQANTCTVKLSNIPKSVTPTVRPLADFVLNNEVEGMRMVIRFISRANLPSANTSFVAFVGRCGRPSGFDKGDGSITARQDLGQIEAMIPPHVFQKTCPLLFKGLECLGTELLSAKSAAYQAAVVCDKLLMGNCTDYTNEEFHQGIRVAQIQGSFIHRPHEGFFAKLIGLLTPGSGKRRMRVGSSLEDGTPYGKAIPHVLGRAAINGIPLQFQDVGTSIKFLMVFSRGEIHDIVTIRCANPEFSQPQAIVKHYGRYGGDIDQLADTVFPLGGFYSRLAYATGYVTGTDIAVEDPAPDIVGIIAGIKPPKVTLFSDSASGEGTTDSAGVYGFINLAWSDNPVDLAVHILTDAGLLNIGTTYLDQARTAKTSVYTTGAVQDDTNAERLILPNTEIGKAGVDYKRYNSTSLVCGEGTVAPTGPTFAGPAHEARYEFYDPNASSVTITAKTFHRKRFSLNLGLTEQRKALDVLHDVVLPSFNGFLSWDLMGRVGIRSERPADSSLMYAASVATATSIKVQDVLPWKLQFHENNIPLIGKIVIGNELATSEVRSVSSATYTADGNSITLAVSSSGGPTLTPSGATFTGGSTTVPASATITVSGTFAQDATVTATINGVSATYTLFSTDANSLEVAKALAFAINANPTLQKYVVAHNAPLEDFITLQSKQGVLNLSSALVEAHSIGEETIRVMMSLATAALIYADTTQANILKHTFKYLGSDGQTRYNQFKGAFHDPLRDFAEYQVPPLNDYDHQDQIGKVVPYEIDLSGVDNYNQAFRVLNNASVKFGSGVDFFGWSSNGMSLQLEEGDRVCLSDPYSGPFRNKVVTVESLTSNSKYEVGFKARVYSTPMFSEEAPVTDVGLTSGLTNFASPPPDIIFNTVDFPPAGLIQATDGSAGITSIRGGAIFGASMFAQFANVRLIMRAGVVVNELVAVIRPNDPTIPDWEAVFEFIASAAGQYIVELEVCNQWGCNTTKPTATIFIGLGSSQGLWTTPMVQLSGAGDVAWIGGGNYDIP